MDYYLRSAAADEANLRAALALAGYAGPDGALRESGAGFALAILPEGALRKPTGTLDAEGMPEEAAVLGFHANLRIVDGSDVPDPLLPYLIDPPASPLLTFA